MKLSSFTEWHDNKLVTEGPRTLSPGVAGKLKNTTDQIDAQMQSIKMQVEKLWSQYRELDAKKKRLVTGMGGGFAGGSEIMQPNDFMKHYDAEVGRRPDMPRVSGQGYPVDHGSAKQTGRRASALKDARTLKRAFDNPAAADFFQKISRADPGNYPVPKGVSPQEAERMVQLMIGGNRDYEDFSIYSYDPESNTFHVGDPSDI